MTIQSRNQGGHFQYEVSAEADLASIANPLQGEMALAIAEGSLWFHTGSDWQEISGGSSGGVTDHGDLDGLDDDDHPQYLTAAEGDAAYDASGDASSAVTAHEGASDPHTGYRREDEDVPVTSISVTTGGGFSDAGLSTGEVFVSDGEGMVVGDHDDIAGVGSDNHHAQSHGNADHTTAFTDDTTVDAHIADTSAAHAASAISIADTADDLEADDVEDAVAEIFALVALVSDAAGAHEADSDPHTGYRLESADHTHATTGLQGGTVAHSALTGLTTGDPHTQYVLEATTQSFSVGGAMTGAPPANANIMVWRAPFACTVTNVRGHAKGGTNAVVNARVNQTSNFLSSNLTVSSMNAWADGGTVQNTGLSAGDDIEIMLVSTSGAITEVSIQVDLTRALA